MFGPLLAPAGGAVIPGSSLVPAMLNIVQCRIGPPRTMASVSCMITTYDLVAAGPAVHCRPGNLLPWYWVFSKGMSPICLKAGEVTVSLAPPFAGTVVSASCPIPTSPCGGGAPAKAAGAANRPGGELVASER